MLEQQILKGVLLPLAVAVVVWAAAWRPWGNPAHPPKGYWGSALAPALGTVAAQWALVGWPGFPPVDVTRWPFFLGLVAALAGMAEAYWKDRRRAWGVRVALSFGVAWLLLRPKVYQSWSTFESVLWVGAATAGVLLLWWQLDTLSERRPGASLPLAVLILLSATSGALVLARSAYLGQMTGAMAAALGPAVILAWRFPQFTLRGAVPVITALMASQWINGLVYAQLPASVLALLVAASVGPWVGEWAPIRSLRPWQAALVRVGAVLLVAGAGLYLGYLDWAAAAEEYPY